MCGDEGKTYSVSWEGFWEGGMHFDYRIFGNNIDIKGNQQDYPTRSILTHTVKINVLTNLLTDLLPNS